MRSAACELVEPLDRSQPTVSHHLKMLFEAGLVPAREAGTWVWYRVVPERLEALRHARAELSNHNRLCDQGPYGGPIAQTLGAAARWRGSHLPTTVERIHGVL